MWMRKILRVLASSVAHFSRDGCAFLSQTIAFNALFATFSLALLGSAILEALYGTAAGQQRTETIIGQIAPTSIPLIARALRQAARLGGIAGPLGLIALIWSAKSLFSSIAFALNRALGIPKSAPLVRSTLTHILMIPASAAVLVVAAAAPLALTYVARAGGLSRPVFSQVVAYATSFLMVLVMSAIIYRFLPNARMEWRQVLPAALVCAFGWTALQAGFGVFTANVHFEQTTGAIAGILGLLIWFNLIGVILLFGAEIAATLRRVDAPEEKPKPAQIED